jgi:uncharacterized membrane-anchored protein YhcB (DUF1043 family)
VGDDRPVSEAPAKRRNRWIWVSAALAIVAAGLLIWALTTRADLDTTQQDLDSTQQQLDKTKQDVEALQAKSDEPDRSGVLAAAAVLYRQFSKQLDVTNDELASTQQDLEDAEQAASKAEKDAATAKQDAADATDDTDKAKAQADQAKAEVKVAESKASIAADCAKGFIAAFGGLFEGDSAEDQAPAVRKELADVTAACKDQLAGA